MNYKNYLWSKKIKFMQHYKFCYRTDPPVFGLYLDLHRAHFNKIYKINRWNKFTAKLWFWPKSSDRDGHCEGLHVYNSFCFDVGRHSPLNDVNWAGWLPLLSTTSCGWAAAKPPPPHHPPTPKILHRDVTPLPK